MKIFSVLFQNIFFIHHETRLEYVTHDVLGLFPVLPRHLHEFLDAPPVLLHQLPGIDPEFIEKLLEQIGDHDQRYAHQHSPQFKADLELPVMYEQQKQYRQHQAAKYGGIKEDVESGTLVSDKLDRFGEIISFRFLFHFNCIPFYSMILT